MKVGGEAELEEYLQSRFCLSAGLREKDNFLDYGCGCLRGTIGLVRYLQEGHFHGCDISTNLLDSGISRVVSRYGGDMGVTLKPVIDFNLAEVWKKKFDFILSVSLVTHILESDIRDCFRGVRDVLAQDGRWFFTIYPIWETEEREFGGDIGVMFYKRSYLKKIGEEVGLDIVDYGEDLKENPVHSNQFLTHVNSGLGQWVMVARKIKLSKTN